MRAETSFRMATVAPEKQIHPLPANAFFGVVNGEDMTTKLTYGEQLKHPNWQRKRLEMLDGADWACQNCGDKTTTLHVHHRQYFKGRMAWEYGSAELAVLCDPCHSAEHVELELLKQILSGIPASDTVAFVGGLHKHDDWLDPAVVESARQSNALAFAAGYVGYLTYHLDIDQMLKVAQFAVSMMRENAEPKLQFTHDRGTTFGEDA